MANTDYYITGYPASAAYIGTWASKPAANTLSASSTVFFTDVFGGSWWIPLVASNIYTPISHNMLAGELAAEVTTDTSGNEQIIQQLLIPAGMLSAGFSIDMDFQTAKSGATDTAVYRLRLGTTGTISDTQITTNSQAAVGRSYRSTPKLRIVNETTISTSITQSLANGSSSTAWPADITISNVSNALYLSLTADLGGTTDTVTLKASDIYLIGR